MVAELDIDKSGLLDGLEGDARRERAELITWLLDRGFTVEQMRSTISPGLLAPNRVLGDDGDCVSAREICEQTGIELDLLQKLQRAAGLPRIDDPDAAVLLRVDAEAAARAKFFVELGIDEEQMITVVRALTENLSHAAEVMRRAALAAVLRPGATELELAQASEALAQQVRPGMGRMIEELMLRALRHGFETEAVTAAERAAGVLPGARDVAVAFADLVGFTQLGEVLPAAQLEEVASHLGELARDVAVAPVRFIKTIGDAVMFVSPDPLALLNAVLELTEAAAAEEYPRLRAGLAFGSAVNQGGDWFGSPVNVASRITGMARPDSVLVAEAVRSAIGETDAIRWSFAGARQLRGVPGEVPLYRARRSASARQHR